MKKKMIQKLVGLLLLCVLAFPIVISLSPNNSVYASEAEATKRTISVNGTYSIKVAPDIAYIDIAVKTFDADVKKAQENNKIKMTKVIEQLTKLKIENKDIRTVDYRIQPRYEWKETKARNTQGRIETSGEYVITGYDVINSIKVTANEFDKVGSIIDVTVQEGVNEANNIAFGLSEAKKEETYLQALKGAVKNGKAKAESIANVYGITLTTPISINESGSYYPSPMPYRAGGAGVEYAYDSSKEVTPILGGEMELTVNVYIIYEY